MIGASTVRLGAMALFLGVLASGMARHAMWRDEIQAWLIVRDSPHLSDLFAALRYEGHPALWYLLLWPFAAFGRQPEWMQAAQFGCASGTVALILWKGPFSRLEMALLPFGYMILFEHGIKSRSYALGNLLLMAVCAVFPQRRRRPIVLAVLLALLANVHALFTIIASAAAAAVAGGRWRDGGLRGITGRERAAVGILLIGLAAAVLTARPAADSGFAIGWQFDLVSAHVRQSLRILSGFASIDWIKTESLRPYAASGLGAVLGIIIVMSALIRGRWRSEAALLFGLSVCGIVGFFHVKYSPGPWHSGLLFMVLVAAVWISRRNDGAGLLPRWMFVAVLVVQAAHGVQSVWLDRTVPYSNGRAIAAFIRQQGWAQDRLFALQDFMATTVVGYLGTGGAYEAQGARFGSFIVWDQARLAPVNVDAFFSKANAPGTSPTVLDCAPEKELRRPLAFGFSAAATFDGSQTGEDCIVYRKAQ